MARSHVFQICLVFDDHKIFGHLKTYVIQLDEEALFIYLFLLLWIVLAPKARIHAVKKKVSYTVVDAGNKRCQTTTAEQKLSLLLFK